jgi:hypothetical protein
VNLGFDMGFVLMFYVSLKKIIYNKMEKDGLYIRAIREKLLNDLANEEFALEAVLEVRKELKG